MAKQRCTCTKILSPIKTIMYALDCPQHHDEAVAAEEARERWRKQDSSHSNYAVGGDRDE